jgi:heme-degrading monooxygenase HmoA
MFTVIFEVCPKAGAVDAYLGLAREMKPLAEAIDGFIDNERFKSCRREGWILSLSTWRDEKAVIRWRTCGAHHRTQERGRQIVFDDYRIRVGEVVHDDAPPHGMVLTQQRFDETDGPAKAVTIVEAAGLPSPGEAAGQLGFNSSAEGLADYDVFESIYNPGKALLLVSWRDAASAANWVPRAADSVRLRHRRVRVIRDYGMFERREAPQYYPDVARP